MQIMLKKASKKLLKSVKDYDGEASDIEKHLENDKKNLITIDKKTKTPDTGTGTSGGTGNGGGTGGTGTGTGGGTGGGIGGGTGNGGGTGGDKKPIVKAPKLENLQSL